MYDTITMGRYAALYNTFVEEFLGIFSLPMKKINNNIKKKNNQQIIFIYPKEYTESRAIKNYMAAKKTVREDRPGTGFN